VRILHETDEGGMGLDSEGVEGEGDTEDMSNDALARRARIAL
jgi:hypothetical protein